jgi:plasmid maintenance system antidote protein VapI
MRKRQIAENLMPHVLLDHLMSKLNLKTDMQLANYFEMPPSVISKVRNRKNGVSANFILLIHEKLDIPVEEIRKLIDLSKRYEDEH